MGKRQLTKVDNFFSQSKIDLKNFCYPLKANLIRIFKFLYFASGISLFSYFRCRVVRGFSRSLFFGQKDVMSGNQIE